MQFILCAIAVLFFGGKALAHYDVEPCGLQCDSLNETSESYSARKSVVIRLGQRSSVVWDARYRLFSVVNTENNLAFASSGRSLVFLNIRTGHHIVVDSNTLSAVYGRREVSFRETAVRQSESETIDFTRYVSHVHSVIEQQSVVSSTTVNSFDANRLLLSFYNSQYNVRSIYSEQRVTTVLERHFGGWIQLIRRHVESGDLVITRGFWGFASVILDVHIRTSLSIVEVFRCQVTHYESLQTDLAQHFIRVVRRSVTQVEEYSGKLTAVLSVLGRVDTREVIRHVESTQISSSYQVTVRGRPCSVYVYRINRSYVVRFSLEDTLVSRRSVGYEIVYARDALHFLNLRNNVVLSLLGRTTVVANRTSETVLVAGFDRSVDTRVSVVSSTRLISSIRRQNWLDVSDEVGVLVRRNTVSERRIRLSELVTAIDSRDVTRVRTLVGTSVSATDIIASHSIFCSAIRETRSVSVSTFVTGLFGREFVSNEVVRRVTDTVTQVSTSRLGYQVFLERFTRTIQTQSETQEEVGSDDLSYRPFDRYDGMRRPRPLRAGLGLGLNDEE